MCSSWLLSKSPFRADSRQELFNETTRAKVEFHEKYWSKVSSQAKGTTDIGRINCYVSCMADLMALSTDFILALVRADPASRLTADQALAHPVR